MKILFANIIKSFIGRTIEVYILLDRCLYLIENGYEVNIKRFFNENISPRAIGIYAKKL